MTTAIANPSRSQNGTELQFKLSRDVDPKATKQIVYIMEKFKEIKKASGIESDGEPEADAARNYLHWLTQVRSSLL